MDENDTVKSRPRPILRHQPEKSSRKKRLSFAPPLDLVAGDVEDEGSVPDLSDPDVEVQRKWDEPRPMSPKQLEYSESSVFTDQSEVGYIEVTPFCKSVTNTAVGLCYVPTTRPPKEYSARMPIVPMEENKRNVFVTALKSSTSSTIKVLIIGHKCEGEKIKSKLLSFQESHEDKWSLRWTRQLEIILEDSPSSEDIINTDYFIFLAHLYVIDTLKTLSEKLKVIKKHSVPTIKGTVLFLPSQQGIGQNIVSSEKICEFMDDHRLCHIQWIKPDQDQYFKLLHSIHDSAGFADVSLLNKCILNWTDTFTQEETS